MSRNYTFLDPDDAFSIVMNYVTTLESELVTLDTALGRVLAEPLAARLDQPRFRKAAVDGYGLSEDPKDRPFSVVGSIAAGDAVDPSKDFGLSRNEGVRIMTGAVVPPDVDRIVRFEFTEESDGERVRVVTPERHTNIAAKGENLRAGDALLDRRRLSPQDLGILASQGYWEIPVVRRPRVAVFSTGSELYPPTDPAIPTWAIYDSNAYQLAALAESHLSDVHTHAILKDDLGLITSALRDAAANYDVVIVSGGVSMGDLDFVPAAIDSIGATCRFHGLAMKPGKPTLFATGEKTLFFGLPGNPVSTVAQFEFFIAPALQGLQGLQYRPREGRFPLASDYQRSNADRHEFLPGYFRDGMVYQLRYQGSGHLSALAEADLIFKIDRGIKTVAKGETVYARFIRADYRLSSDIHNG